MKFRVGGLALCALLALHCNGSTVPLGGGNSSGGQNNNNRGADASAGDTPSFDDPGFATIAKSRKVDILLAVDNSAGMTSKQAVLAQTIDRIVQTVGAGTTDIHLGVVTSSLGNFGGNVCDENNPAANTHARLQRTDKDGALVKSNGVLELASLAGLPTFIDDAKRLVLGVGNRGCGLEAQLESVYRFLVQPDPLDSVKLDAFRQADVGVGIDVDVLKDRADFLRPDSLLVVLMATDEDDSSPDPMSVGGFGYAFANRDFPGSQILRGTTAQGTTAPRGTSICATDPGSADCTSCGFAQNCDAQTPSCQKTRTDANCTQSGNPNPGFDGAGFDGFYPAEDDDLNVRFFRMKERFGVDPQYPIERYIAGFSASSVPDREAEHTVTTSAAGQRIIASYTYRKKCTNPLFATSLPTAAGDELCNLPRGPRSPELVVFGVLGGAPPALVETPTVDWNKVLGADPEHFDYTGIDPHMVQSIGPRADLLSGGDANSPRGSNGADPITGREWNTRKKDLQYACTFDLPAAVACVGGSEPCACSDDPASPGMPDSNAPLCATDGSPTQTKDKAYPSTRELTVARRLGARAVVGSICPRPGQTSYADFAQRLETAVLARVSAN